MPTDPDPAATARFDFFFYGTLRDGDVRAVVFGRTVDVTVAHLAGYEAVPAAGARYPMLIAQRGSITEGVLCCALSLADAARLGFYEREGSKYAARVLTVRDGAGMGRQAWVYLPTAAVRRGMGRWALAEWQRFAKRDYLARLAREMRAVEPVRLAPYVRMWSERAEGRPAVPGATRRSSLD